jgi:hypothetical protein
VACFPAITLATQGGSTAVDVSRHGHAAHALPNPAPCLGPRTVCRTLRCLVGQCWTDSHLVSELHFTTTLTLLCITHRSAPLHPIEPPSHSDSVAHQIPARRSVRSSRPVSSILNGFVVCSLALPQHCHRTVSQRRHARFGLHPRAWVASTVCMCPFNPPFRVSLRCIGDIAVVFESTREGGWTMGSDDEQQRLAQQRARCSATRFMSFLCCLGHHLTRLSVPFTLALSFVPQLAGQPQQRTRMRSLLATRPPSTLVSRYVCFPTVTIHLRSQRVCAQCVRSWTRVLCVWCQEDAHRCGMVPTTSPMPHTIHAPTHPAHH